MGHAVLWVVGFALGILVWGAVLLIAAQGVREAIRALPRARAFVRAARVDPAERDRRLIAADGRPLRYLRPERRITATAQPRRRAA